MAISDYYAGLDKLAEDHGGTDFVKISPSQAASFFTNTTIWYRETLLGEKRVIENQDSLALGTIVHYFAEQASLKIKPDNPEQLVTEYLAEQKPENADEILSLWKDMANELIKGCILGQPKPLATELFMYHKLLPGIYVGGTTDAIIPMPQGAQEPDYYVKDGKYMWKKVNKQEYEQAKLEGKETKVDYSKMAVSIRDYKTAATKPTGISYGYRLQAHIYAFLATKLGYNVEQIELQYVIRPTKTLPCRHFTFTEPFTKENLDTITDQLQLMAESIDFWNKNPEYRYLLAQDYRLRLLDKPILFK